MTEMWSPSGREGNDLSTAYLSSNSGQPLAPGSLMHDRYRVVTQLGAGGSGFVYLVHDEHFDARPLRAMKEMILRLDDRQQQLHLVNFKREADLLETLRHPNIPRVYDSFSAFLRAYLVLEYVEGEDLKQVLDRTEGFLSHEVVGNWMIQLCTIVEYLHSHTPPIIFRDLKPSNVILTPDQRIILIDFGIATVFSADEQQASVGTLGYAALEQYHGEAEIRSDVYALGGMMHHLLTKSDPRYQPPFSFDERPPSRLNPAVTPELEHVIMRCLEVDRDYRYQSVRELRDALEGALRVVDTDTDSEIVSSSLYREGARYAAPAIINVLAGSAATMADGAEESVPASAAPMSPADAVGAVRIAGAEADAAYSHRSSALTTAIATSAQRRRTHGVPSVWAVVLLAVLVLLLTGAAVAAVAPRGAVPNVLAPFTSSNSFASSHAPSAAVTASPVNSPVAGSSAQRPLVGTPSPAGAPTSVPNATPLPMPTATATPAPAILSVSPTTITISACVAIAQAQFMVANTGGMSLSWTATDNGTGYHVIPSSGSIPAGGHETVTVSNILLSGSVMVTAANAQHSPQHVSITCTV